MFIAQVDRLVHEELLEWLGIRVDKRLPRHKHAFVLYVLIILGVDIVSNDQKGAILEIAHAVFEDRLCCVSQHMVGVFTSR
jgi:hypothetical protein